MEPSDDVRSILPDLARKTGCEDWREVRKPLQRRDCRIHFLRSASFRLPDVVLKTYRPGSAARNHARVLFQKSRSFHEQATAAYTVPEHLMFSRQKNSLVMEYVAEPLAGDLLIRRFHSPAARKRIITRTAGWLRWFHALSGMSRSAPDPDRVRRKIARVRTQVHRHDPAAWEADRFLKECADRAVRYAENLATTHLLHAVAHGDYTPFNVFLGPARAYGFDYNADKRVQVHQDICRFLLYLDIYRIRPPRDSELAEFGCRRIDYETFFSAYGEDAVPEKETWLALQYIEITRRLASIALQRSRRKGHMLRFLEDPHLRRKARHIARRLG